MRGEAFVEQKICKAAVRIKLDLDKQLELGNIFACRDFGHSKDYVKAMHLILQQDKPDNYVVATGVTKSINDVANYVFERLDLSTVFHLVIDPKHKRPQELDYLKGDASKIRALGWEPEYTFESMLDEMIAYQMKIYGAKTFKPEYY
jgi:GDPmannose 4,6-dehydratase